MIDFIPITSSERHKIAGILFKCFTEIETSSKCNANTLRMKAACPANEPGQICTNNNESYALRAAMRIKAS